MGNWKADRTGTPRVTRAADAQLDKDLTMAARNAGPDYEADKAGIEEDLADLEDWEEKDGEDR